MSSQASQSPAEAVATAQNNTNLASMCISGVACSAFQPLNSHSTIPLSLPPQGDFNSFAELKQHAQDHCKFAGWAIVEGKGSEKRQGRYIKYLVCKHFGKIDRRSINEEQRKKFSRTTKKTDCNVKLKVRELANGLWSLRYMEGKTQHNHEVNDPSAYFEHRRLNSSQFALIVTNHAAGIPASRTKSVLERTNSELILTPRDIYIKTAQIGKKLFQGKDPNQTLID